MGAFANLFGVAWAGGGDTTTEGEGWLADKHAQELEAYIESRWRCRRHLHLGDMFSGLLLLSYYTHCYTSKANRSLSNGCATLTLRHCSQRTSRMFAGAFNLS